MATIQAIWHDHRWIHGWSDSQDREVAKRYGEEGAKTLYYNEVNHCLPLKITMYRDGVGHSWNNSVWSTCSRKNIYLVTRRNLTLHPVDLRVWQSIEVGPSPPMACWSCTSRRSGEGSFEILIQLVLCCKPERPFTIRFWGWRPLLIRFWGWRSK